MQSSHSALDGLGCALPLAHGVGAAAPVEQNDPGGHTTQSSWEVMEMPSAASVAFWNRPLGHGSPADAPLAQYSPALHPKHAVRPLSFMNLPAAQSAHHGKVEVLVAPRRARQAGRSALCAVLAAVARVALLLAALVHELARVALHARWLLGIRLHGARAAR